MPAPTTAVLFNTTSPEAPPDQQNNVFQSDGGQPLQRITSYTPPATAKLCGAVRPDNVGLQVDVNGVMSLIASGGGAGGGTAASGLVLTPVKPSGAKDGSNTLFTLPAPPVSGTFGIAFLNGVQLEALGTDAEYAVQGTQFTTKNPPQSTDRLTYYYYQGSPNSESGGGGTVPLGSPTFLQGNNNYGTGTTLSSSFPMNNAAGSCLIVDALYQEAFAGAGSFAISDSQGNTWVSAAAHSPESNLLQTWYALNCKAGPNTVTVTYTGFAPGTHPGMAMLIHEYAAVQTVSAFDVDDYVEADTLNVLPMVLALTTTADGDLLHICASAQGTGAAISNTGGWVTRESNSAGAVTIITFDALAGAAGVYSNSVNVGPIPNSIRDQCYLLALKSL